MNIEAGMRVMLNNGVSYPYRVVSLEANDQLLVRLSGNPDAPWRRVLTSEVEMLETQDGWKPLNEPTGQEIMQQLDRWIDMCATDHPGDYHQALVDFRNLITRQGPYQVQR